MTTAGSLGTPGSLFDSRYELLKHLGSGKSGDVWQAIDRRLGRTVALKILAGTDEDAVWHEATRLTDLSASPHILDVHNAGLAIDVPYLDTALAELGTAATAAHPYGLPADRAVHTIRGPLQGLELCHQRGILHRDVKPANIFLTDTGGAQLGDFGLAVFMDPNGHAKATGDPDIRAPETLKGAPHTRSADVYGAGLSLYALLTGSLPHSIDAAGGFPAHKANVLAGMPDIRDAAPHVGIPLAKAVRNATAADPAGRYPTAADFDAALGALPRLTRDITRTAPHSDHDRCWQAIRKNDSHVIDVCQAGPDTTVRHRDSGTRVRRLCTTATTAQGRLVALRRAFDHLRAH